MEGTFRDHKSTKESLSTLTDRDVEDAVSQPPMKKKTLISADADGLKFVCRATDEISGATSDDSQSSMPQNLETALLALTEALKRK